MIAMAAAMMIAFRLSNHFVKSGVRTNEIGSATAAPRGSQRIWSVSSPQKWTLM